MRIRFVLALMVAGVLCAAGIASAQDTSTEPLSGYTSTTPTVSTPTPTTTTEDTTSAGTTDSAPSAAGETDSGTAPAAAGETSSSSPKSLAFTGGEPLLFILLGVALAGGTVTLLVRDKRRSQNR